MTILELNNITKTFGGIRAVDSITIGFKKSKITGLIGPNGAGKTTLFNLINGFFKPDFGIIRYKNIRIDSKPPWKIAKLGIGRLFQDVRVFGKLTVLENVLLANINEMGESPFTLLLNLKEVKRQEKENIEKAKHWINFVGLSNKENSPAESLSFGQQKLLAIARLLAGNYEVLLLDEPTAGVNPALIKSILKIFLKMIEYGKTIIFIEHNMNVILEIADWVYFLDEGKVTAFGSPSDVLENPEVRKTYLGL